MSKAEEFTIRNMKGGGQRLTKYMGTDEVVTVPDGVTEIASAAFKGVKKILTEITIPESVKHLEGVFNGFPLLEKVTILGEGLEQIDSYCFYKCPNLKELHLPDSVYSIGSIGTRVDAAKGGEFEGCTALLCMEGKCLMAGDILVYYRMNPDDSVIEIPEGVRFIQDGFLEWDYNNSHKFDSVEQVILPEGIISIGADIFGKLQNLKELSLPHSLKAIRSSWGTIVRKNKIKQLTLHENLSWMGIKLKDSMEHLESLDLSAAALTSIPYDMASECKNLVSVKLPAGLKEIRWEAFAACEQLKEVEIPDSVVEIGVQAFMGCKELEKVTLPAGLESIGEDAFAYCPKLSRPKLGEKLAKQAQEEGEVFWGKIGFGDENGCVVKDGVLLKYLGDPKHVVISEGVRVIPESLDRLDRASYLGSYIKTLRLPDSLELFEEGRAFKDVIYGLSVNLPPKYLQTKEKLPSAWTVKLIEGPWKDQVQLKDWAALYLFQSGKRLMELCEKALEAEPEQAVVCFKELLEDGAKPSQKKKAEAFALKYQVSMSQPEVQKEGKDSKTLEPDENGCVVKNGVLVEYRGDRIHAVISEGVRVIPKDVLPDDADKTSFSSLQKTYKNRMRSCHLPESLEKIEYQRAFMVDTEISLPSRYLQTRERLNEFSLEMVMEPFYARYGWGKLATIKDYAAMYLFQPGKKVQKFCLEKLEEQPDETVRAFGALLSEGAKSSQAMSAAQFAVNHREKVSEEGFQSLLAALSEDPRLKEAAALVAPFAHKGSEEGQQAVQDQLTDQVFKKLGGEDKYLEEVKLLDGRAAPAALVKRAIVPYLELLKEKPQYISGYKEDYLPVQILKEADEEAEKLEKKSFQDALEKLFDAQRRTYRPSRWNGLKRATKTGENSPWMYPYARYGSGAQIAALITDMNQWDNWDVFSASGRKDIIIARSALMLSDTREAILKLDKDKVLDVYADMRNTTADAIRDQQLSDFGLDAKGQKTYGLGTKTIIVSLEKDLTLSLYDTEAQKTVKSIPKKGADPQLAAKAAEDLAEMKKNLKKTAKARSSKLFEEFLTGKTRPAIQWMDIYLKNPLLRQVAQLVVWNQGTDTFTLMADGAAIDCDGAPYEIDRGAAIGVAHPMEMTSGQVKKWRDYFVSEKLKQPFAQVWEPAIDPGSIRPDMYASWELPYYRFMNQDQHGIHEHHNFYSNEWNVWCDDCEVWVDRNAALQSIEDMVVVKEIRFRTYTRKVNHIIAYLDKIAFIGRVLRDDASIGSSLDAFTQAQIMEFITAAMENHCVNSLAVLMDYKNRTFGEEDPMKEFTLE